MDVWALYSAVSKFALYLGALGGAGLLFNATLFRTQIAFSSVMRLIIVFAVLGFFASILGFGLRGGALMGAWSGVIDVEILSILWETPVGTALAFRVAGFLVIMFSLMLGARGLWPACAGGLLVLWSFTQIGHVSDKGAVWLQITLMLHLIIAAFWLGVLTPLRRLAKSPSHHTDAAKLGHRFGQIAAGAIPILLIAGGVLTYQLVGGLEGILTPYGLMLISKLVGVAILLGLGAANKLRIVPKLQTGAPDAANHLANVIGLEWGAFVSVLAITAFLTSSVSVPA